MRPWKFIILFSLVVNFSIGQELIGGIITAKPSTHQSFKYTVDYDLSVTLFWTLSLNDTDYMCDNRLIDRRHLIGTSSWGSFECTKNGDKDCYGERLGFISTYCKYYSFENKWIYGERIYNVAFPLTRFYEAAIKGISELNSLFFKLDTKKTKKNGLLNSTPIGLMPPVVTINKSLKKSFSILVSDPDLNDTVRCRWSDDAAVVGKFMLDRDSCTIQVPETSIEGMYLIKLQLEDFEDPYDLDELSSIPLTFHLKIIEFKSECPSMLSIRNNLRSSCTPIPSDVPFTQEFIVETKCNDISILNFQVIGLDRAIISPLEEVEKSIWRINITWLPKKTDYGPNLFCIYVTASNLLNTFDCFTLLVDYKPLKFDKNSQEITHDGNGNMIFSLNADQMIRKPSKQAYMRIFNEKRTEILAISALNAKFKDNEISFESEHKFGNGNYFVLFDQGVALASISCYLETDAINDESFWTFKINKSGQMSENINLSDNDSSLIINKNSIQNNLDFYKTPILISIVSVNFVVIILLFLVFCKRNEYVKVNR